MSKYEELKPYLNRDTVASIIINCGYSIDRAYKLFNYYAKECEKLEERIKLLRELNDKLQEQIAPKGSYTCHKDLKGA